MKRHLFGASVISVVALLAGCGSSTTIAPGDDGGGDASTDGSTTPGDDSGAAVCGNGVVELDEECDLGANNGKGKGCNGDCTFTCVAGDPKRGDAACDDHNPCNGTETCNADHTCKSGTALSDGTSCGTSKICKAGVCADAVCGDGIVTAPEECDDGNTVNGDGCDNNCKFSCVSTDTTRNCTSTDPCVGNGTCNDTKHVCTAGAGKSDGTSCGTGKICKGGTCVGASCGDGIVEAPEECDFGSGNGPGTGCEVSCTFSCHATGPTACAGATACESAATCSKVTVGTESGMKCTPGTPVKDGTTCTGGTCAAGVCKPSTCGNGKLDAGEDCDFGAANGPGTGCETNCKYSCHTASDCAGGDPCLGTATCSTVTVTSGTGTGQKCKAGTPLAACAACGTGGVCISNTCKSSTCGDSCVDASKGETCDPPATGTCDTSCHKIVAAVCGNGKREAGEQCDDSNTTNLDGCNSKCQFEQDHRINQLKMQFGTDAYCTANALGGAIQSVAQSQIQAPFDTGISNGTMNIMFEFLGLTDLTGTSAPSFKLGGLNGTLVTGTGYSGTSDLDWWYTTAATSIDASRLPLSQLPGSIAAKTLTAGPGNFTITVSMSGALVPLALSNVNVKATVGATSTPKASTGATPGHLATENLDPTLVSFATTSNGQLCGAVSAYSLSKVPAPAAVLAGGGATACSENYTASNSILDVIVGGCHVIFGITAVVATQPDTSDPTAPVAGAGPAYTLTADPTTHAINGCQDKSGATVTLATCLNSAAYTSYFKFTTDRVIAK